MERKEAIEVVKKNWPDSSFTRLREALETLIPELKESGDETVRKAIKKALQVRCDGSRIISDEPVTLEEAISWLEKQGEQKKKQYQIYESTKDRFYKEGVEDGILIGIKKQKPAWSEEDEVELVNIIDFLNSPSTAELCPALRNNAIDWLKSLKDRYTWKPSDEQMEVLNWCKPLWNEPKTKVVLESLIEDLKKLREE